MKIDLKGFQLLPVLLINLWVYPLLVLMTLLGIAIFPVAFLCFRLLTDWSPQRIMQFFIWVYGRGWLLIIAPFVRVRREWRQPSDFGTPSVIVLNHLSFFDTYCMALMPFFNMTFAVRSWPFRMPWYGFFMRLAGYLDVERIPWEEIVRAARQVLAQGGHLIFFPEGHRSRDGELQRFYAGAFKLARELDCPVIPVCIDGTDRLLPPGRRWLSPAGIRLRALPAIDPQQFAGDGELRRAVKAMMAGELAMMREE
ncbi:MAG: lysophospholipid acyltransferase family protein [Desulfuromonadales bacterium]